MNAKQRRRFMKAKYDADAQMRKVVSVEYDDVIYATFEGANDYATFNEGTTETDREVFSENK